jgi:carboxylesterase
MPVKPLSSLFALTELCKQKLLPQITIPCLIMQSTVEHTVKPSSAAYIYEHLGSQCKELVWYRSSGHILTLDIEREEVFKKISEFFRSE